MIKIIWLIFFLFNVAYTAEDGVYKFYEDYTTKAGSKGKTVWKFLNFLVEGQLRNQHKVKDVNIVSGEMTIRIDEPDEYHTFVFPPDSSKLKSMRLKAIAVIEEEHLDGLAVQIDFPNGMQKITILKKDAELSERSGGIKAGPYGCLDRQENDIEISDIKKDELLKLQISEVSGDTADRHVCFGGDVPRVLVPTYEGVFRVLQEFSKVEALRSTWDCVLRIYVDFPNIVHVIIPPGTDKFFKLKQAEVGESSDENDDDDDDD